MAAAACCQPAQAGGGSRAGRTRRLAALVSWLLELAFWAAAARSAAAVAAAMLLSCSVPRVAAVLLAPSGALSHLLLVLLSLETWAWQAAADVALAAGGPRQLSYVERVLPEAQAVAACWPLDLCNAWLQLAIVKLSPHSPARLLCAAPFPLPFGLRLLRLTVELGPCPPDLRREYRYLFVRAGSERAASVRAQLSTPVMSAACLLCSLAYLCLWASATALSPLAALLRPAPIATCTQAQPGGPSAQVFTFAAAGAGSGRPAVRRHCRQLRCHAGREQRSSLLPTASQAAAPATPAEHTV
ncbi:hypothetical protein ABPG75_007656 [Micractinium tetrahymenae]